MIVPKKSTRRKVDTALEIWVAGRSLDLDRRAIREMDRLDAFIALWLEHGAGGRLFRLRRRRPLVHWTGGLALEGATGRCIFNPDC